MCIWILHSSEFLAHLFRRKWIIVQSSNDTLFLERPFNDYINWIYSQKLLHFYLQNCRVQILAFFGFGWIWAFMWLLNCQLNFSLENELNLVKSWTESLKVYIWKQQKQIRERFNSNQIFDISLDFDDFILWEKNCSGGETLHKWRLTTNSIIWFN